ncbi:cation efflux protein, CzcI family [Cupriavidus agavae]|uniref:Cobalt-zinc-cadmium resistance protein n=1 Tax=Cupriavidus agavae TaxID=1001822 RepID=A0A4Q7RSI4_9BURK|nr:cation efflux protein, CzcI family [Cupriavidus agavae]RZT36603.1 hypothetical protein EV147_3264 [Cupriavidus agavae]
MRRFLLICLLFVLPFQFSWAAAASYCQHETTVASWHLGHHEHRHQAAQDGVEKEKMPVVDTDCGVCHAVSVPMAWGDVAVESQAQGHGAGASRHEMPFSSRNPSAPDRPQWQRLA